MKFLTLLTIIGFLFFLYYGFKYIIKHAPSFLLKRWIKNIQKGAKQDNSYKRYKSGETEVSYKQDEQVDPGGDYVDFEDLNDNK